MIGFARKVYGEPIGKKGLFFIITYFFRKSNAVDYWRADRQKSLFFNYNIFLIKNQIGKICRDFLNFYLKSKRYSRETIDLRCSSQQFHTWVDF